MNNDDWHKDVHPLKNRDAYVQSARTEPIVRPRPTPQSPSLPEKSPDRPGAREMDRATARRFRDGPVNATLDLHGRTMDQAAAEFRQFILDAWAAGHRTLLVITGKGTPDRPGVLRSALGGWADAPDLRRIILQIHPARPDQGGSGAWIIILRRAREQKNT